MDRSSQQPTASAVGKPAGKQRSSSATRLSNKDSSSSSTTTPIAGKGDPPKHTEGTKAETTLEQKHESSAESTHVPRPDHAAEKGDSVAAKNPLEPHNGSLADNGPADSSASATPHQPVDKGQGIYEQQ